MTPNDPRISKRTTDGPRVTPADELRLLRDKLDNVATMCIRVASDQAAAMRAYEEANFWLQALQMEASK